MSNQDAHFDTNSQKIFIDVRADECLIPGPAEAIYENSSTDQTYRVYCGHGWHTIHHKESLFAGKSDKQCGIDTLAREYVLVKFNDTDTKIKGSYFIHRRYVYFILGWLCNYTEPGYATLWNIEYLIDNIIDEEVIYTVPLRGMDNKFHYIGNHLTINEDGRLICSDIDGIAGVNVVFPAV